jgi:hypothetical protein
MRLALACIVGLSLTIGPLALAGEMTTSSGRLPAPPHDASGHTWHHPDGVLFRIVKEGTAAVVGQGYESDMPAFAGVLSDQQIHDVLAFIKSTWPKRELSYQAEASRWEAEEAR